MSKTVAALYQRFPLRYLPHGPIVRNEGLPSCSFFCEIAEQDYAS